MYHRLEIGSSGSIGKDYCRGEPVALPHVGKKVFLPRRAFVQEHDLVGCEVAFCKGCHETFSEQILDIYKMMERFDEGALNKAMVK